MVGLILTGTTRLDAQERVTPGEPFLTDSLGWFFTDSMVEDMARDAERVPLLERQNEILEDLLALEKERSEVYKEVAEESKPNFWQKIPDVVWFGFGALTIALLRD